MKRNKHRWMTVGLLLTAALLGGCDADDASTPSTDAATTQDAAGDASAGVQLQSLAKATQGNTEVELLAAGPLAVGYNRVFYRVTVDGKALTTGTVEQKPLMDMGMHKHACPVEQPGQTADADGLFAGAVLPQMASGMGGSWSMDVVVTPAGGQPTTVALGSLAVAASPWSKTLAVGEGEMKDRYTVMLRWPAKPKVGSNNYDVLIHKMSADMMQFSPVTDATLADKVEMPSMGHGSPGNVTPAGQGSGVYAGKINLTMPGDWRLTLTVSAGGSKLGDAVFDFDI